MYVPERDSTLVIVLIKIVTPSKKSTIDVEFHLKFSHLP